MTAPAVEARDSEFAFFRAFPSWGSSGLATYYLFEYGFLSLEATLPDIMPVFCWILDLETPAAVRGAP